MSLPLIAHHAPSDVVVWRQGRGITAAEVLGAAERLAARLPAGQFALNCCEDRYRFMVAFLAVLLRGQTNLMPPSRAPELLLEIAADHTGCYYLSDDLTERAAGLPTVTWNEDEYGQWSTGALPTLAASHLAARVFTSGSTGKPRPNDKTWGSLTIGTALAQERFIAPRTHSGKPLQILATVPPQHMYGLETSILYPLLGGACVHAAKPLFPADVASALAELPEPRLWVTTPFHLRACLKSGLSFPAVDGVISATAPLAADLARDVEHWLGTPVEEIYGCTEAGSLASRRTVAGERWQMFPQMRIEQTASDPVMQGPQLAAPVPFQDVIEVFDSTEFALRGRSADLLNIAGKRASLADLTHQLLSIPGVEDAVMLLPDESGQQDGAQITRLAAVVVAPTLDESVILAELRQRVDAAFLPRPLVKVAALPRSESSKLPRAALLALVRNTSRARPA